MNNYRNRNMIVATVTILLVSIFMLAYFSYRPEKSEIEKIADKTEEPTPIDQRMEKESEVIAENLNVPWEVAFLPNGEILVTERSGTLLILRDKTRQKIIVDGVKHIGEGGLLGLAVHPNFSSNHLIYLYLTTISSEGVVNGVDRYQLEGDQLIERKTILSGISGSANHDGGRIDFGPDGDLYITTGDAENVENSQNINSLNGKILRVKDDGSVPKDNPFGNPVYSFGHRNPQGLTWDNEGRLWATEHGRSGILSGLDELNLIEKGKNYGWPVIQGEEKNEGMISPIIQSGPSTTWAPAGAVFYNENIFFTGLRGEALFKYELADRSLKKYFPGKFGRIRAVVLGPDNYLYITTSNKDGRGTPKAGDDKLIKINPETLK